MKQANLGQLFVIGFTGASPSRPFLNFIKEEQIGGVIFFEVNCPSAEQTRLNIETIRGTMKLAPAFIAIDQEGGRVVRLRGIPAEYKAAGEYAKLGSVERFIEDYSRSAGYLESLGFNLNLAPVADLELNSDNKCTIGRCFGSRPEQAEPFIRASIQVAHSNGLLACLKHFPGLGASGIDPHLAVASADYDRTIWHQRERKPFAAGLDAGADMVMTTHLRLPALDNRIVTGSKLIVEDLLRGELGFDGPVITDDLSMSGADDLGTLGERTVAAFNAGHDLLLFGQQYEATMSAYDYFCDAVASGEVNPERVKQALERVSGLKYRLESSLSS